MSGGSAEALFAPAASITTWAACYHMTISNQYARTDGIGSLVQDPHSERLNWSGHFDLILSPHTIVQLSR